MKCDELAKYTIGYLDGTLRSEARTAVEAHLETCAGCRDEIAALRTTWAALGSLPEEEPSGALRQRFYAVLESEAAAPGTQWSGSGLRAWLASLGSPRLVAQTLAAALILAAGIFIGTQLGSGGGEPDEGVDGLRAEMRSLSQLVTLSLLQQESASERLKGVRYGSASAAHDEEVLTALIDAVGHDPSVNVRLAAIDALRPHVSRRTVRNSMLANLRSEKSPLVQVSLVDALLEANGRETRETLESLIDDEALDETVRTHVRSRLEKSV